MKVLASMLLLALPFTATAQCKATERENFPEFIAKFAEQKSFATARTIYPSYTLRHEYGIEDDKGIDSVIKTPVSKDADAKESTMNEFVRRNGMKLITKSPKGRQAIVEMSKEGTDWLLTYHFIRQGNCWFLHHIEDHSL